MDSLLARLAENAFWLGRYMERAEGTARLLAAVGAFDRSGAGDEAWRPVLRLHGDVGTFLARHPAIAAGDVVRFYLLDDASPSAVRFCLDRARGNARSMRHLLGTEIWRHLNALHGWLHALDRDDVGAAELSALCARIVEDCQTVAGGMEGTLHRDQTWRFVRIGGTLERADRTLRLLDANACMLARPPTGDAGGAEADALLHALAAHHIFRRLSPRAMEGARIFDMLLCDAAFPRSAACAVRDIDLLLYGLKRHSGLAAASDIRREMTPLFEALEARPDGGPAALSSRLRGIQARLDDLSQRIASAFFH